MATYTAEAVIQTVRKLEGKKDMYQEKGETLREEVLTFAKGVQKLEVSDDAKVRALESLIATMRKSLETQHDVDAFLEALKTLGADARSGAFDEDGVESFSDDVQDALAKAIEKVGGFDAESASQFQKLEKIARPVLGGAEDESDEDLMIDDTHEPSENDLKCPITTGLLIQPMVSKKCGHTYSKSSVQQYFSRTPKKCAVFGCSQMLTTADFKRDIAKETALKEYKRRQQRATQNDALDVDDE